MGFEIATQDNFGSRLTSLFRSALQLSTGVKKWTLNTMLQPSVDMRAEMRMDVFMYVTGSLVADHLRLIAAGNVPKGECWELFYVYRGATTIPTQVVLWQGNTALGRAPYGGYVTSPGSVNAEARWLEVPQLLDSLSEVRLAWTGADPSVMLVAGVRVPRTGW